MTPPLDPNLESAPGESADRRIRHWMLAFWLAVAAGAWWHGGVRGAAGATLGGLLSWINYAWLRSGVNALGLLYGSGQGGGTSRAAMSGFTRFLARFVLLAAALYAIFISHLVPILATVAGLFAAPFGVLAEALCELFRPMKKAEADGSAASTAGGRSR